MNKSNVCAYVTDMLTIVYVFSLYETITKTLLSENQLHFLQDSFPFHVMSDSMAFVWIDTCMKYPGLNKINNAIEFEADNWNGLMFCAAVHCGQGPSGILCGFWLFNYPHIKIIPPALWLVLNADNMNLRHKLCPVTMLSYVVSYVKVHPIHVINYNLSGSTVTACHPIHIN